MPQKQNHGFQEKYPYIRAGTLEPMRMKDILTKNSCFRIRKRHFKDIRFSKDINITIVKRPVS